MFRAALKRAIANSTLIRIHRVGLVDFTIYGYVLAATEELVLMQPFRDRLDLDGYDVIRVADITKITRLGAKKTEFYETCLALKGQQPSHPTSLELESMASLLRSASAAYPLIVMHREKANSDTCEVGRNVQIRGSSYRLEEISPEGHFDRQPRSFPIADITLVQFECAYEKTLAAVAASNARIDV